MSRGVLFFFAVLLFIGCEQKQHKGNIVKPVAEKAVTKEEDFHDGDIIFQTSLSEQSIAIQLATNSKYSHCGIIYQNANGLQVLEAIEPVKFTPLKEWVKRGENGKFVVKRLKNADSNLTPAVVGRMKSVGNSFISKHYDHAFEWSDEKIYCSELVWKIYKEGANLEVGKFQKLKDFDLSAGPVQQKIRERYGQKIPLEEKVVSPAAIFESELLETVFAN